MPIYEYRCSNGHTFEAIQRMSDDPLTECEQCGAPVERVFHPIAVHFKGSGFYSTDYGSKNKAKTEAESKANAKSESKSESKESKSGSDSGSDSKPGSKKEAGKKEAAKTDSD